MTQAQRDLAFALEELYGSDQSLEAGCLLDKLNDLGWTLTPAPLVRVQQQLPQTFTSTSRLPKGRTP